jgi:hypothetical protein
MPDLTLLSAADTAPVDGFTAKDALATLVGVESFLFGALNVAIAASLPTQMGIRVLGSPRGFAIVVAGVVTLVGVGALLAWLDAFLGDAWPEGCLGQATAVVILLAIVVQPILTVVVAIGVKGDNGNPHPPPPPRL